MTLTSNDSSVLAASSIEGALPIAGANPVDLILIDSTELPMVDRRLCHQPSRTQPGRNIPVVVLTHDPSPEHREHCLEAGAGDVLPRPFSPLTLIETVELSLIHI